MSYLSRNARLLLSAVFLSVLVGCNAGKASVATTGASSSGSDGGDSGNATATTGGLTTGGTATAGTTTAGGTTGPVVDAPFGLDTRPSNTTCLARPPPAQTGAIVLTSVFPQFFSGQSNAGWIMAAHTFEREGQRWWLVATRNGYVRFFRQVNSTTASAGQGVIDISTLVLPEGETQPTGEAGLLDMVIPPDFVTNPFIYVSYTRNGGQDGCPARDPATEANWQIPLCSHLSRFPVTFAGTGTAMTLSAGTEEQIQLQVGQTWLRQPTNNHNGGALAFGAHTGSPDHVLYMSFGDGGGGDDTFKNGQNPNTIMSKILRMDLTCDTDNVAPLVPCGVAGNVTSDSLIFASGFRNPWQMTVDRGTALPWVGDVGQDAWEELDRVVAGGNYGWPTHEGSHSAGNTPSGGYPPAYPIAGAIEPIAEYATGSGTAPRSSIAMGSVYRGSLLSSYVGDVIFGDVNSGELWRVAGSVFGGATENVTSVGADINANAERFHDGSLVGGATLHEDQDGEVYVASNYSGSFFRLDPGTPTVDPLGFPALLSETGCVREAAPRELSAGLIPYEVISPLWSDNAAKRRWIGLPDGGNITLTSDGDFEFPNGTVLVKEFKIGATLIETRLFMRHDDEWRGYSYHWNEAQTDAALADEGFVASVAGQNWAFPGRGECNDCHTQAAGVSLGLEVQQLNSPLVYGSTNRRSNQLATLEHIGALTLPAAVDTLDALPSPSGTGTLDERARSYLHSNCSNCHRPLGVAGPVLDMRYDTPLEDTGLCNEPPTYGDADIGAGAMRLAPGRPDLSVLHARMNTLGADRMPKLGSLMLDTFGTQLIADWITSISACP